LLRILRGLDKNRILVFLNRIDQLGDPTRDVPMIVQHVGEGLRRELPGTDFPIVAGSAFWADAALRGEEADIEQAWSAKAQAYAQHLAQQASAPEVSADDKAQRAQSLLISSGLPALFAGLAQLTPESHIGRVLLRVSQSFRELAKVGENAARHELAVLSGEDLPDGPEATVEELQAAETEVKDTLARLEECGDVLLDDRCTKIDETLRAAMRGFSDAECTKLREAIAAGHHTSREWTCDFTLLRQQLEEALVLAYRAAESEMRGIETEHLLQLQQMLKRYNSDWAEPTSGDPIGMVLPTIGTPSIVLSLDEPWWRRWLGPGRTSERRAAALARLIEHEFSPIVGALTQAARTQLQVRRTSTLQEAELVYLGLIDLLQEQTSARVARQSASRAEDDLRRESPEMQRVRETQVAELKKQASEMSLLANRLESIDRDVHREDALAG
jgi:hypothetical protein